MTGVLLDTSILIEIERGALDLDHAVGEPEAPVAMAAITACELLRGVARLPAGVRRARSERWLDGLLTVLPVVDYDLEVARIHAALWAELTALGRTIGAHDQMIAATALSLGYELATRDAAFHSVPELRLRRW